MVKNKIIVLWVCLLMLSSLVNAQDFRLYTFIKPEFNDLHFPKNNSDFENLCHKLDLFKEKKLHQINVVHIGGSHVQGGTWSNSFENELQKNFNTRGGGYFVFPYHIAKTNGQPYARSYSHGNWKKCWALGKEACGNLGMNCMSVSTHDSICSFGVRLTEKAACSLINSIKVYHNFNKSFSFELQNVNVTNVDRFDNENQGYTIFSFSNYVDSVSFKVNRINEDNPNFVLYGFSLENTINQGFYLAGLGMNGASSSSFLKCGLFTKQLTTLHPDIVIISLGVNDTQNKYFQKESYKTNYDSLIAMIRTANPKAVIILTTTTDNYVKRRGSNKNTISAQDAMYDLMLKNNVIVWDLFSVMGGYKSIVKWYKAGLASKDRVHFTSRGYEIIGKLMFDAVNKAYTNNKK